MKKDLHNISGFDSLPVPSTREIERQVLAELVQSPEQIPLAKSIVTDRMFNVEEYSELWRIIVEMDTQGQTIDLITVGGRIGNAAAGNLILNTSGTGSPLSVTDHCRALKEAAFRRSVFTSALDLLKLSGDNSVRVEDLIQKQEKMREECMESTQIGTGTKKISTVLNTLAESIETVQIQSNLGKRSRIPTGFPTLDYLTFSGLNAGNLVILSARPSVGKSAIMLQMAKTAAIHGFHAAIYSLEMTGEELCQRLLFATGFVTPKQLSEGKVHWESFEKGTAELAGLPICLNDDIRTIDDIATDIMAGHHHGKCDIAFIDYLGLIQSDNSRQAMYQAIAERTGRLKQLAKQCRIPIVLLCQLNRNSEAGNRPPELIDLRDSGAIEQDADIVLMLERQTRDLDNHDLYMWVRKNRNGRAGNIRISITGNATFTEFHETERSRAEVET